MDSKCSRERSREEDKSRLNDSQDESEECAKEECNNFDVFNDVYQLDPEPSNTESNSLIQHFQDFALTDYYKEIKSEKKTNDNEDEDGPTCLLGLKEVVKTSTIEELDFEYNRLWSMGSEGYIMDYGFDGLKLGQSTVEWSFEKEEEKGISWLDLDW